MDGESGLRGPIPQKMFLTKYGVHLRAQPKFKRMLAERFVKEIKLRVAVALELEGGYLCRFTF
jgi:hypothetical protein